MKLLRWDGSGIAGEAKQGEGVGEALMAIGNLVQVCLGWPAVGGGEAN